MRDTNTKGFSIIELLVTMVVFLIIAVPVVNLILNFGEFNQTEHARIRLQQESRYIFSNFATELKDAGAILTLANTGSFLNGPPLFNGIYPLNSTTYADGIIVATGDPHAVTTLSQPFQPSAGMLIMRVANLVVIDPDANPATPPLPWQAGDIGIVIGTNGYYVFAVQAADTVNRALTLRANPVYYSGLLNTTNTTASYTYVDPEAALGNIGNTATYPRNAPVIRLARFGIYLVDELPPPATAEGYIKGRITRQLVRITDTGGTADVLAGGTGVVSGVVSDNIWDLQISYFTYPKFPSALPNDTCHFNAGLPSPTTGGYTLDHPTLMTHIRTKFLKSIHMSVVTLTDDYGGRVWRGGTGIEWDVPAIKDRPAYKLPEGKYNYKKFDMLVEPKNFNIML